MTAERRENISLLLKVIGVIGVIFGMGKYFWDLDVANRNDQKIRSAELVDEYRSGKAEIAEDLLIFLNPVITLRGMGAFDKGSTNSLSDQELVDIFDVVYLGKSDGGSTPLLSRWLDLLRYYDAVHQCVESKLCDQNYLQGYLCREVKFLERTQQPFISYFNTTYLPRDADLDIGGGLSKFAQNCA